MYENNTHHHCTELFLRKFLNTKIFLAKISLHKNFQIYGTKISGSGKDRVLMTSIMMLNNYDDNNNDIIQQNTASKFLACIRLFVTW